jgi:alkylhydroperoxidase family enzyme
VFRANVRWLFVAAVWAGGALAAPAAAPPAAPRFPLLSKDDAWRLLPRQEPPLPVWARALAGSLPRTTAAMLELDRLHRAGNPLGPVLAGKLRWAAADEVGCAYARRYAEADLLRAGMSAAELKRLAGAARGLPTAERAALAFARKLTRAGHTVTDAEVAELIEHFGAEKVVAMAHTVAFANFQARIFLALGAQVEPGGPLPPLEVGFDLRSRPKAPPARPRWGDWRKTRATREAKAPPGWQDRSAAGLEASLERQKGRGLRIPLPGPERLARIPPEAKAQAARVIWTKVSMGYQPALTRAWFECMNLFHQEARLDRVFCNSCFWVITRSNECFY